MRQFIREVNGKPMENEIFGLSMPLVSQITSGMESSSSCVDQVFTFPTNALTSQSQPYYLTSSFQPFSSIQEPSAIGAGFNPQELLISQSCAFGAEDEAEMIARRRWTPEQQFPYAYGVPGNELSLTLGSLIQSDKDQCSELSCSGITRDRVLSPPAELTSSYLHAANQILAEITAPSLEVKHKPHDPVCASGRRPSSLSSSGEQKTLTSMLQMIDREYDECVDRVQNAIAAFRTGTGSFPAHTPARFALHAVSALYNSLRDRINLQMQKLNGDIAFGTESSLARSFLERQWELQKMKSESQSWRPQRGLPEKSVAVLRNWMFQNFLHPYPRDNEKQLLAIRSGLTRSQVSNWFINARVRLWKPMIEDMYQEMSRKPRGEEEDG